VELEHIGQGTGSLEGYTDACGRSSSKYVFEEGDVLFGRLRPYLRKNWRATRAGVCSTEIWPLIPAGPELNAGLLSHIVQMDGFIEAASAAYGTHMPRADWTALSRFPVWLPPTPNEQISIAQILTDMDTEIATLEAKLTKARQLKQGMAQELLSGRIRLI
jgi:type I restriction enzyme S subunit